MSQDLRYVNALKACLPTGLAPELADSTTAPETLALIDRLLCFASGGECPDDVPEQVRQVWDAKQAELETAMRRLVEDKADGKRKRDEDPTAASTSAKRVKVSESGTESPAPADNDRDDAPLHTLHAISVSSPVRKKVDVTVHERSLKFVHPSTTVSIPRSSIKHAFLLPTRGKAKPHWTVVLLTDAAASSRAQQKGKAPETTQIIFGLEAAASSALMTTTYPTPGTPSKETHPKNTPTLPLLRTFFNKIGVQPHEPSTSVFRSTLPDMMSPGEAGSPSLTAYMGAKPGSLYFFETGLLWGETKPYHWWPLEDLAPMEEDEGSLRGGVRVVWAGGRLCTIVLSRKGDEEGVQELDEGEETHLGMVDAKEKGEVEEWVRRHKRWFGKGKGGSGAAQAGKVKEVAMNGEDGEDMGDSDDEEDEDFEGDSDSDGGSPTEDSEEEGDGGGEEDAAGSDASGGEEDGEGDDDDEEGDLNPARHPLMRPGAVPKMSKGVMDMVVGVVEQEFLGPGNDLGSEEEDELDD